MRLPAWLGFQRISAREYRANLDGLNMFFGAVLGIVMAGTETLDTLRFAGVLMVVAAIVVGILYISAGRTRVLYALLCLGVIWKLPALIGGLPGGGGLPDKLQPTLAVWALMTIGIEFLPRERAEP